MSNTAAKMLDEALRMTINPAMAYWIAAPGRGELRLQTVPEPAADEVIVQTLYSGVSRGTEALVFAGAVPQSEWQRMRAPFQEGDFPTPVKYGYANVGRVTGGVPALIGQTVFCLYPHQSHYVVPVSAVQVLPQDVPPARAVLAANLETAVNAIWDAQVLPGDEVRVVGGGSIGLLTAWLASRIAGCTVQLIDTQPQRAVIAQHLGFDFALPEAARAQADVVFHASGTQQGLTLALSLAGFEAFVTELSWYGDRPVSLALGGAFHSQRLRLQASQVGSVASAQRPRWNHARRLGLALRLLQDDALDVLINSSGRFAELPVDMPRLAQAAGDVIMHRVSYD